MTKLPDIRFVEGICWRYLRAALHLPSHLRPSDRYALIGRVGDKPFLLDYDRGLAVWQSPANLDDSIRKKILTALRKQVRHAPCPPGWCKVVDLTDLHHDQLAEAISQQYHDFVVSRWRAATLGDREEDYVDLAVPFAQKGQAKAAGAKWDPGRRVWRVNLAQVDPNLFHAWLPADRQAS